MSDVFIYVALALFGLILGSFSGATVWRIRARQLRDDKKHGEKVGKKEYDRLLPLLHKKLSRDRSQCLHCGYELTWYDLIPLVSWITLRGRCRECKKPIGIFEPLIELGLALFFVLSYALWPVPIEGFFAISSFILWLVAGVGLAILAAYDAKWSLLPDKINIAVIGVGLLSVAIMVIVSDQPLLQLASAVGAVGVLSGLYLALYLVSKGRWIGFGDIKLGLGLALLLGDWRLALIALFMANLVGCLVVIPLLITKRLKRNSHVPFGPFLIAGMIIAQFVGPTLIDLYTFSLI
ncbi:MAG: prepilin peptidase [Candidatus Microsaccharimonas sp.]